MAFPLIYITHQKSLELSPFAGGNMLVIDSDQALVQPRWALALGQGNTHTPEVRDVYLDCFEIRNTLRFVWI